MGFSEFKELWAALNQWKVTLTQIITAFFQKMHLGTIYVHTKPGKFCVAGTNAKLDRASVRKMRIVTLAQ